MDAILTARKHLLLIKKSCKWTTQRSFGKLTVELNDSNPLLLARALHPTVLLRRL